MFYIILYLNIYKKLINIINIVFNKLKLPKNILFFKLKH